MFRDSFWGRYHIQRDLPSGVLILWILTHVLEVNGTLSKWIKFLLVRVCLNLLKKLQPIIYTFSLWWRVQIIPLVQWIKKLEVIKSLFLFEKEYWTPCLVCFFLITFFKSEISFSSRFHITRRCLFSFAYTGGEEENLVEIKPGAKGSRRRLWSMEVHLLIFGIACLGIFLLEVAYWSRAGKQTISVACFCPNTEVFQCSIFLDSWARRESESLFQIVL